MSVKPSRRRKSFSKKDKAIFDSAVICAICKDKFTDLDVKYLSNGVVYCSSCSSKVTAEDLVRLAKNDNTTKGDE